MHNKLRRRLPSLDGLRALAISLVVVGHAHATAGAPPTLARVAAWLPSGHVGVELFFVISGFIITYLLNRELARDGSVSLAGFYYRRVFRILPALGLYLICVAGAQAVGAVSLSPYEWLTSLTFTRNFMRGDGEWIIGHLWSLSVEEQFYVFWPVLFALVTPRARYLVAGALVALAPLARGLLIATHHAGFANNALISNVDFLMAGAALGLATSQRSHAVRPTKAFMMRVLAIGGSAALIALEQRFPSLLVHSLSPTLRALLFAVLIYSVVFAPSGWFVKLLNLRPIAFLGTISYSLYLWQQAFLVKEGYYGLSLGALTSFPWNLCVSVLLAFLSFRFFEQPALAFAAKAQRARCARRVR